MVRQVTTLLVPMILKARMYEATSGMSPFLQRRRQARRSNARDSRSDDLPEENTSVTLVASILLSELQMCGDQSIHLCFTGI